MGTKLHTAAGEEKPGSCCFAVSLRQALAWQALLSCCYYCWWRRAGGTSVPLLCWGLLSVNTGKRDVIQGGSTQVCALQAAKPWGALGGTGRAGDPSSRRMEHCLHLPRVWMHLLQCPCSNTESSGSGSDIPAQQAGCSLPWALPGMDGCWHLALLVKLLLKS